MTHYIRYFIFTISLFLSLTAYAVDHITCSLTSDGIPAQTQAGQTYSNTYTCLNTYPASFPPIQLVGTVLGDSSGTDVKGNCKTDAVPSGGSCKFKLKVTPQEPGKISFFLQVSVGSLYFINLPQVTTKVNPQPPAHITWPGFDIGSAQADSAGNGAGTFTADATDSSGHPVTYVFAIIAGPGTVTGSQTGTFTLTGVNASTVVQITATADDAASVVGTPIPVQISSAVITWPGFNSGMAHADSSGNGSGTFTANATDSSGHPVTYVFAIIAGPGTVTGSQTGTFTLTGVNASTVVQITATADDAASVVGTPIHVQITSAHITWPGSNSGTAQADSTGNGAGSFVADATDSSGHPVTYVFAIIAGPGTVTGLQTGTFSLTGVDASTVVQITATANDAPPVVGTPIHVQVSTIPIKILAFYNNTSETIYPVIEAPMSGVVPGVPLPRDPWMQGLFGITDVNTFRFQATKLHRVYVNGTNGIPPMQSALVSVPFYSDLVPNPSGGNVADQYVDWWSSMRVYIYDVQSYLIQTQSEPGVSPVTLFTPGPTCISGCSQTSVFSATGIMPTNDPQQLTEYTFADVITSNPPPYPVNLTIVNYDYSGVDQIYLPIAMEPYGSSLVGYTGTVVDLTSFRDSLNTFLSATLWPVYSGLPFPRVPGAYNVVTANSQLTDTVPQTTALTNNWNECLANAANPNHSNCETVHDLFVIKNYQVACSNSGTPAEDVLIQHIYGYVSFCAVPLPSTGPDFNAYTALQHNFLGYAEDFNPYTQLIHAALEMNVYAYSVDDAVGFIRAIGNGIVLTVGGEKGLTNSLQYNKQAVITVSPGTPPPGPLPVFTNFGVCSSTASSGQLGRGEAFSFQLPQTSFPCEITLKDSNNLLYHFTLKSPAPLTTTAADIGCAPADQPWCASVVVTSAQGISTTAPNH